MCPTYSTLAVTWLVSRIPFLHSCLKVAATPLSVVFSVCSELKTQKWFPYAYIPLYAAATGRGPLAVSTTSASTITPSCRSLLTSSSTHSANSGNTRSSMGYAKRCRRPPLCCWRQKFSLSCCHCITLSAYLLHAI